MCAIRANSYFDSGTCTVNIRRDFLSIIVGMGGVPGADGGDPLQGGTARLAREGHQQRGLHQHSSGPRQHSSKCLHRSKGNLYDS